MGCATANRQRPSRTNKDKNLPNLLESMVIRAFLRCELHFQCGKSLLRLICVDQMEVGVDLKRLLQFIASLFLLSQCFSNDSGVKEKKRVMRSELHGSLACFGGLFELPVLIERPCEGIPGVYVMADFKFFLS